MSQKSKKPLENWHEWLGYFVRITSQKHSNFSRSTIKISAVFYYEWYQKDLAVLFL